ncbi:MAG: DUF3179 domain-containing protein [Gaiellales bacterium]
MSPARRGYAALALLGVLALLAAGCGSSGESVTVDLDGVPPVDTRTASVPLEEIVFDTFEGSPEAPAPRFVPLPDASRPFRRSLLDRIRPVYAPVYGDAAGLAWLADDDLVLGYESGDDAYAYPVKVLDRRELVNDEIDGVPLLVTYCPLCASAVVYDRRLGDGRTLLFGNTSALFESDLIMFDHQTGSYWFQVRGEAIVGQLTGARLRPLPSATMTWAAWQGLHPGTRLLVADGQDAFDRSFALDAYAGYADRIEDGRFSAPVTESRLDRRLRASEVVISVEVDGVAKAYAPALIGDGVVGDEVGGAPIVVVSREAGFASAFRATLDGEALAFTLEDGVLRDAQTGSEWDDAGRAVAGPLAGARLEPLPVRRALWFSISLADPGIEVVTDQADADSLSSRPPS